MSRRWHGWAGDRYDSIMKWAHLTVAAVLLGGPALPRAAAPHPDLSGTWTLHRGLSDAPSEVGFDPYWHDTDAGSGGRSGGGGQSSGGGGGGRGGRGGGGGRSSGGSSGTGNLTILRESSEDAKIIRQLVRDVKNPPATLVITQTDASVTIADPDGDTHTFHTNGKEETLRLEAGGLGVVSVWEPMRLLLRYKVEKDRELRFTFARAAAAGQLLVTTQFADHGRGQIISRIYEAGSSR